MITASHLEADQVKKETVAGSISRACGPPQVGYNRPIAFRIRPPEQGEIKHNDRVLDVLQASLKMDLKTLDKKHVDYVLKMKP